MAHQEASSSKPLTGRGLDPVVSDSRSRPSYNAGESSSSGRRHETPTLTYDSTPDVTDDSIEPMSIPTPTNEAGAGKEDNVVRKRSVRANGGFLLGNNLGVKRSKSSRIPRRRPSPHAPETTRRSEDRNTRLRVASDTMPRQQSVSPQGSMGDLAVTSAESASPASQKHSSVDVDQTEQNADVDSTQIVNMALKLSESRRLASRRNVSRGTPPRLATLPVASSAGNELRQQLRQQRRSSRNESPDASKIPSPRFDSSKYPGTSLQNTFDAGHDASYLYHFSASTLARAQKAKEQLELMSQYRRLLDEVPPLKPRYARPVTSSPPGSPLGASKVFSWSSSNPAPLGRKYNPLQYIRNRKVRARERKMIDGEKQGFGDVESVKAWVDKIHRNTSLSTGAPDEANAMPIYPNAEDEAGNAVRSAPRVRRARVDWFIEPCDMIADTYWLEQDDNKQLIEDRHWRKIFPLNSNLSRPLSRDDQSETGIAPFTPWTAETAPTSEKPDTKHGHEHDTHHNSIAIERAKEKLHHFKDLHHWHSHGHHDHSRPHSKKDSASERSDSERETAQRTVRAPLEQKDAAASKPADVLQKQMLEMIAKETKDNDVAERSVMDVGQLVPPSMVTPEKHASSKPASRFHSRRGSLVDTSDSDKRANLEKARQARSPPRHAVGHHGLDTTGHKRSVSREYDASVPTSPNLLATRNSEPDMGAELSPAWSRTGSPTRNPIKKIKQIIHDKSAEGHGDSEHVENEDALYKENSQSPDATGLGDQSQLAPRKSNTAPPYEGYVGHRRTGSLRNRVDDQTIGLRGMFKGSNNVIRGGVSKLGDILRKKEGSTESHEADTSDESDSDRVRGRARSTSKRPRTGTNAALPDSEKEPKHFLGTMPEFQHAPNAEHRVHASGEGDASKPTGAEKPGLTASNGLLQPPIISARSPSASISPQRSNKSPAGHSDASEAESAQSRKLSNVQDADLRLNSMLGTFGNRAQRMSRQWSIADDTTRRTDETQLSRREVARMKALIKSSGIKAMEINRRSNTVHKPYLQSSEKDDYLKRCGMTLPNVEAPSSDQTDREVAMSDLYPVAAQALSAAIQSSAQRWQSSADRFTNRTCPELHRRVGGVRSRVAEDLSEMTRGAMDQADETSRVLALDQPLEVKHVVDIIEKMMRRRRRRLRWVRRALWLTVEWLLVGFMWYVWFVVTILRIFLGVGNGIWSGVKWLLWL